NFNRLHSVDAHDRLGQPAVQPGIPPGMRTKPDGDTQRNDLESASHCIAVLLCIFYFSNHRLSNFRNDTPHHVVSANRFELLPGSGKSLRNASLTDGGSVAENIDSKKAEEDLGQRAARDTCSRFSGARPLQNIAGIGMVVFERSG